MDNSKNLKLIFEMVLVDRNSENIRNGNRKSPNGVEDSSDEDNCKLIIALASLLAE